MKNLWNLILISLIILNIVSTIFVVVNLPVFLSPILINTNFAISIIATIITLAFGTMAILSSFKSDKLLHKVDKKVGELGEIVEDLDIIRLYSERKEINAIYNSLLMCEDYDFIEWLGKTVANIEKPMYLSMVGYGSSSGEDLRRELAKIILHSFYNFRWFYAGDSCADSLCNFMEFCGTKGLEYDNINDEYDCEDMVYPLKLTYKNGGKEELTKQDLTLKGELFSRILMNSQKKSDDI